MCLRFEVPISPRVLLVDRVGFGFLFLLGRLFLGRGASRLFTLCLQGGEEETGILPWAPVGFLGAIARVETAITACVSCGVIALK